MDNQHDHNDHNDDHDDAQLQDDPLPPGQEDTMWNPIPPVMTLQHQAWNLFSRLWAIWLPLVLVSLVSTSAWTWLHWHPQLQATLVARARPCFTTPPTIDTVVFADQFKHMVQLLDYIDGHIKNISTAVPAQEATLASFAAELDSAIVFSNHATCPHLSILAAKTSRLQATARKLQEHDMLKAYLHFLRHHSGASADASIDLATRYLHPWRFIDSHTNTTVCHYISRATTFTHRLFDTASAMWTASTELQSELLDIENCAVQLWNGKHYQNGQTLRHLLRWSRHVHLSFAEYEIHAKAAEGAVNATGIALLAALQRLDTVRLSLVAQRVEWRCSGWEDAEMSAARMELVDEEMRLARGGRETVEWVRKLVRGLLGGEEGEGEDVCVCVKVTAWMGKVESWKGEAAMWIREKKMWGVGLLHGGEQKEKGVVYRTPAPEEGRRDVE